MEANVSSIAMNNPGGTHAGNPAAVAGRNYRKEPNQQVHFAAGVYHVIKPPSAQDSLL